MKNHLRQEMKRRLAAIAPADIAARSHAACQSLIASEEFRRSRCVMLYMPMPHEASPLAAAMAAWQQDKIVLVPKVDMQQRHMIAVRISGMGDEMVISGRYAIREPASSEPWPLEEIDLVVVPALAYDRDGNRLGRGAGFYDRFLGHSRMRAIACGLALSEQVVEQVPTAGNDWPVNMLVTDKEIMRFIAQAPRRPAGQGETYDTAC
ncbi:MAG: 5-formyltetrahydrofolate cyclo-ligase [Planctomycetaceae bacterium]|nr:5-formyltetrahydrofolate cyclo-ligase [Planctomycetaceae bacterium]